MSKTNITPKLELKDIQGIILSGYGSLKHSTHIMLTIKDEAAARIWLKKVIPRITTVVEEKLERHLNIAFTKYGLRKIGLPEPVIQSFAQDFVEGPLHPNKLRMLGDTNMNHPEHWHWGKDELVARKIHILLMLYAREADDLKLFESEIKAEVDEYGMNVYREFPTHLLPGTKEHFGFKDGISQPAVEGYKEGNFPENIIKAGEFILGYKNEYDQYPETPVINPLDDPKELLPNSNYAIGMKDFGTNGTYLVFRQLEQDVKSFWEFIQRSVKENPYGETAKGEEYFGAKLIGRWPDGSPLEVCPVAHDNTFRVENSFLYAEKDPDGKICPVGSHIRRANPRDSFEGEKTPQKALSFSKKHRLIRRARPYGKPVAESMHYKDILSAERDKEERGIYFICINADLSRQFEFMQQSWMANPKFQELYNDPDPLIGTPDLQAEGEESYFTLQGEPIRQRIPGIKSFVTVKGNAYFFMPGIKALKYLAEGF